MFALIYVTSKALNVVNLKLIKETNLNIFKKRWKQIDFFNNYVTN